MARREYSEWQGEASVSSRARRAIASTCVVIPHPDQGGSSIQLAHPGRRDLAQISGLSPGQHTLLAALRWRDGGGGEATRPGLTMGIRGDPYALCTLMPCVNHSQRRRRGFPSSCWLLSPRTRGWSLDGVAVEPTTRIEIFEGIEQIGLEQIGSVAGGECTFCYRY